MGLFLEYPPPPLSLPWCPTINKHKSWTSLVLFNRLFIYGAWNLYVNFKMNFTMGRVEANLIEGIEQGYYRKEINPKILATLRVEQIDLIFNSKIFPRSEYDFSDVQMQIFDHFVQGILTEKGRQLYSSYQSLEEKPTIK